MNKIISRIALLLVAFSLVGCYTQIDTGNVGVSRTLGKVQEESLPPSVYFTIFKNVDEFTAKEVPLQIQNLKPKSRDNLTMTDVDMDVYFKVNPAMMAKLYIKYQGDVSRVMKPYEDGTMKETGDEIVGMGRVLREARESIYWSVAQFDATTMHQKRDDISAMVMTRLQSELDRSDKEAFLITNVNIRALVTDPALEQSIREQVNTDQEIAKKKKQKELAQAEADRRKVEALGEAAANEIISASLTPTLMRAREIEAMAKFATQGTHTVIMPTGTTPLVQIR